MASFRPHRLASDALCPFRLSYPRVGVNSTFLQVERVCRFAGPNKKRGPGPAFALTDAIGASFLDLSTILFRGDPGASMPRSFHTSLLKSRCAAFRRGSGMEGKLCGLQR